MEEMKILELFVSYTYTEYDRNSDRDIIKFGNAIIDKPSDDDDFNIIYKIEEIIKHDLGWEVENVTMLFFKEL
jgi:hypothetical protein